MLSTLSSKLERVRRRPLAAAAAAILGLCAPAAYANTNVTNCLDDGSTGSLRAAIAAAPEGGTIDATGLTTASQGCSSSTITLITGDITVAQNNLSIQGPGMHALTVIAAASNRIFTHTGTSKLHISDLSVSGGYIGLSSGDARGGCIYSKGSLYVRGGVYSCSTYTSGATNNSEGGAIFAKGEVFIDYSVVSGNSSMLRGNGTARGGAIFASNTMYIIHSSVSGNYAGNSGGAAYAYGKSVMQNCTISGNSAGQDDGALDLVGIANDLKVLINQCTISGNTSLHGSVGGVYAKTPEFESDSSTIAFNTAANSDAASAVGMAIIGAGTPFGGGPPRATLKGTLVSNNTFSGGDNDFSAPGTSVGGSADLVRVSGADLPSGTIVGKCPLLGPLRDNGGPVQTHALLSGSPAIDKGSNQGGWEWDERGSPYARTSSPAGVTSPVPDIGAYEVQQADIVFNSGFDGCS